MKTSSILLLCFLFTGCSATGGSIIPEGRSALTAGKAVVVFSAQVTDGTRYDNCSVFVGRSAMTAQWFAWPAGGDDIALIALEVTPGDYGFHRFGCMYRSFQISTGTPGPQFNIAAGDIRYLGRLTVSETEIGTAAGYSRMPTSVRLSFEDKRSEDFEALSRKWPLFTTATANIDIPQSWGGQSRYTLRPYQDGVKLIAAPII